MKKMIVLFTALFVPTLCSAQSYTPFGKVDTVTTGECDDSDPALSHIPVFSGNGQTWLVFARNTSITSEIVGKKLISVDTMANWDSMLVPISVTSTPFSQRKPDIAKLSPSRGVFQLAAWEYKKDTAWNIYYSKLIADDSTWSTPQPLTHDTVDNTNVRIRPLTDSTFLILWKRKSAILYSLATPLTCTAPETVSVSTSDSVEFDYADWNLVWTSRDTSGKNIMIRQWLSTYPTLSFSAPDTLFFEQSVFNPQLVWPYGDAVLFETLLNSNREVYLMTGSYAEDVSNDPLADYRNARLFTVPLITKRGDMENNALRTYFSSDVLVMERYTTTDSMLLFFSGSYSDTLRTAGYNRNAKFEPDMHYYSGYEHVLVVWESNRSGRSHIYSRTVSFFIYDVKKEPSYLTSFSLEQNYPNPFNPSTKIQYRIPNAEFVTLKVYDVLGREVATLVNEKKSPGTYEVEWNASAFSSSVYFYRLTSGDYTAVKKLLLLK